MCTKAKMYYSNTLMSCLFNKKIELFSAPGCRKVVPEEDPGEKDEKEEHEVSSQDNEVSQGYTLPTPHLNE